MKKYNLLIIILFCTSSLFGQNFVLNGSFENTVPFIYLDPCSAFDYLENWYPANYYIFDSTLTGTPDLFDVNNRYPSSNPSNFWNVLSGAADGDYHAGIANHLNYTGYHSPETIASGLISPLEANEYYTIEMQFRNKGVGAYLDNNPIFCVKEQGKQIDVLFHTDSIFVTIDEHVKNSYDNSSRIISLRSEEMDFHHTVPWREIGTCFEADGSEKFIGVTTNRGKFSVDDPCVIEEEHWDVFYLYYFDLDDIQLKKLPEEYTTELDICTDKITEVSLYDLIDFPKMQNEIEFHWEDGTISSNYSFSQGGTYQIDAILDCKTIPVRLEVNELICEPKVFVPTGFSPNEDGFNDELEVYINSDFSVKDIHFSVFTRQGIRVFDTNDLSVKWDGTVNGKIGDLGVYIWMLSYTANDMENEETKHQLAGDVTLLR